MRAVWIDEMCLFYIIPQNPFPVYGAGCVPYVYMHCQMILYDQELLYSNLRHYTRFRVITSPSRALCVDQSYSVTNIMLQAVILYAIITNVSCRRGSATGKYVFMLM